MKVILVKDVPALGQAGEVKEVKKGYGFNYLLPEGLAELATPGALKSVQHIVARAAREHSLVEEKMAQAVKSVDGKLVTITMKAKDGKLFGSVTKASIQEVLGGVVAESMIVLEHPIKNVGEYEIPVVAGSVSASVKLSIVGE